ncbi:hypothetical protein ACW6ND_09405, partial [Bifidobacterium adolescentis]
PGSMTTSWKRTDHRSMDGHDPKCATFRALPAICELIVNAIMHCSYNYSSIQIVIYDNRLEITSPERLPMGRPLNA